MASRTSASAGLSLNWRTRSVPLSLLGATSQAVKTELSRPSTPFIILCRWPLLVVSITDLVTWVLAPPISLTTRRQLASPHRSLAHLGRPTERLWASDSQQWRLP